MSEKTKTGIHSFLTFKLGGELYTTKANKVFTFHEMFRITEVPNTPEWMMGITNPGEEMLMVIDTMIKFGISATELTKDSRIIVMTIASGGEDLHVGILVDELVDLIEIDEVNIKPVLSIGEKINSAFIRQMVHYQNQSIKVFDIENVFTVDEFEGLHSSSPRIPEIEEVLQEEIIFEEAETEKIIFHKSMPIAV